MSDAAARILIFCKAPVPGTVKTRLAASIGAEAACRLHEELARRMIDAAVSSRLAPVELWCAPTADHPFFDTTSPPKRVQTGADLGERMANALVRVLGQPRVERAVLVGTDCPPIDGAYLAAAFAALDDTDAVLGPAADGGYGLIGFRRIEPSLVRPVFDDIEWSTEQVAAATIARLEDTGLTCTQLPVIWDVDRPEDLARYQASKTETS